MSAPAVSLEDWARLRDEITKKFVDDDLPLKSKQNDDRETLIDYMDKEHGFRASLSQYENQLQKWGVFKRLTQKEWRLLFPLYDHPSIRAFPRRILAAGRPVKPETIERARRVARDAQRLGDAARLPRRARRQSHPRASVQYQYHGQWHIFTGILQHDYSQHRITHSRQIEFTGEGMDLSEQASRTGVDPDSSPQFLENSLVHPATDRPRSPTSARDLRVQRVSQGTAILSAWLSPDSPGTNKLRARSPFFQMMAIASMGHDTGCDLFPHNAWRFVVPFPRLLGSIIPDASALIYHTIEEDSSFLCAFSRKGPTTERLMKSLLSLLPPEEPSSPEQLNSHVCAALLYSLFNDAAGFGELAKWQGEKIIVAFLTAGRVLEFQLLELLLRGPRTAVTIMAEKLIELAIKHDSDEVLSLVLHAASRRPDILFLENIFSQKWLSELSGWSEPAHILKLLEFDLAEKASTELQVPNEKGRHSLLMSKYQLGTHHRRHLRSRSDYIKLLEHFQGHGCDVRVFQLDALIDIPGTHCSQVLSLLDNISNLDQIEKKDDGLYYERRYLSSMVSRVQMRFEADECVTITRKLLEKGRISIDFGERINSPWWMNIKDSVDDNNPALVCLLLEYRPSLRQGALARAIANSNLDMAKCVWEGPDGAAMADSWTIQETIYQPEPTDSSPYIPTEPLKEALRTRNWGLAEFLKNREETNDVIRDQGEVPEEEAAMLVLRAVVDEGNLSRVQKVLEGPLKAHLRAFQVGPINLGAFSPIHFDTVQYIVRQGLEVDSSIFSQCLILGNTALALEILENSLMEQYSSDARQLMTLLVKDNRLDLVDRIVHPKRGIRSWSPVNLAIATSSAEIIQHFLNLGYGSEARKERSYLGREPSLSPVLVAVRTGDRQLLRLLLASGVDVTDEVAFEEVARSQQTMLTDMIEAFCSRYPCGIRGFGSRILVRLLFRNEINLLERFLNAKLDADNGYVHLDDDDGGEPGYFVGSVIEAAFRFDRTPMLTMVRMILDSVISKRTVRPGVMIGVDEFLDKVLLLAIETGRTEAMELAISKGAQVTRCASFLQPRTPLQHACQVGIFDTVFLLVEEYEADVNALAAKRRGGTAIQFAAISGSIRIAKYLLDKGAFIHQDPSRFQGRTALEGAAEHGRIDMIKLLWDHSLHGVVYGEEEIESAKRLAKREGKDHCAKYIDQLAAATREIVGKPDLMQIV